ncbi:MAG: hypothetical protein HKN04_02325, partial [Rhodothermaceae bacterium]|nr:hypothetical protein [Rhodothermaceae bacterium]
PEASGETAPLAPAAKRPWTILGRLSAAVREQNWFAVVLEVVIVVLGVVIGFQITAWGQNRANREQEQVYLHQLVVDLRETEQEIAEASAWLLPRETGAGAVLRSFYEPTRPHPDTLLERIVESAGTWNADPVTGTAEALVATGDLSLLREDSLRSAITSYLQIVSYVNRLQAEEGVDLKRAFQTLRSGGGQSEGWDLFLTRIGLLSPGDALYPFPPGPRRNTTGLFDVEAFLSDPTMEVAASTGVEARLNIRLSRGVLLDATVALREQVEAEIER